jgi:hypothetical protein
MGNWEIAILILSILGGVWGIIAGTAKVIKPLVVQMTKLNDNVSELNREMAETKEHNHQSHNKLWLHENAQDNVLHDHETRISIIERGHNHD